MDKLNYEQIKFRADIALDSLVPKIHAIIKDERTAWKHFVYSVFQFENEAKEVLYPEMTRALDVLAVQYLRNFFEIETEISNNNLLVKNAQNGRVFPVVFKTKTIMSSPEFYALKMVAIILLEIK